MYTAFTCSVAFFDCSSNSAAVMPAARAHIDRFCFLEIYFISLPLVELIKIRTTIARIELRSFSNFWRIKETSHVPSTPFESTNIITEDERRFKQTVNVQCLPQHSKIRIPDSIFKTSTEFASQLNHLVNSFSFFLVQSVVHNFAPN